MKEINQDQLEQFRKLGLIDEIALRNYYIRIDFEDLRKRGLKICDVFRILAEKYNRSESLINQVLYKK